MIETQYLFVKKESKNFALNTDTDDAANDVNNNLDGNIDNDEEIKDS